MVHAGLSELNLGANEAGTRLILVLEETQILLELGLIMDAREKTLTTQTTGQIRDRFGYKRSGRDRGRRRQHCSRRQVEIEIEIYSKGGAAAALNDSCP